MDIMRPQQSAHGKRKRAQNHRCLVNIRLKENAKHQYLESEKSTNVWKLPSTNIYGTTKKPQIYKDNEAKCCKEKKDNSMK